MGTHLPTLNLGGQGGAQPVDFMRGAFYFANTGTPGKCFSNFNQLGTCPSSSEARVEKVSTEPASQIAGLLAVSMWSADGAHTEHTRSTHGAHTVHTWCTSQITV